ncbi:unnamed protein product [Ascophyllum nodosum]
MRAAMTASYGAVIIALLRTWSSRAFMQPRCPGALACRGVSNFGAKACKRMQRSASIYMSEQTENRPRAETSEALMRGNEQRVMDGRDGQG